MSEVLVKTSRMEYGSKQESRLMVSMNDDGGCEGLRRSGHHSVIHALPSNVLPVVDKGDL